MSNQAFGWIVEVTDRAGSRKYHVAVRNRVEAADAVRRRVLGAAAGRVEAVTMLSKRAVTVLLRLKPGELARSRDFQINSGFIVDKVWHFPTWPGAALAWQDSRNNPTARSSYSHDPWVSCVTSVAISAA
jgi:hypothetical protein